MSGLQLYLCFTQLCERSSMTSTYAQCVKYANSGWVLMIYINAKSSVFPCTCCFSGGRVPVGAATTAQLFESSEAWRTTDGRKSWQEAGKEVRARARVPWFDWLKTHQRRRRRLRTARTACFGRDRTRYVRIIK